MEKEVLKRIFDFLEGKENCNPPFLWKVKSKIQLTEKDLNVKGDLDLFDSKIKSLPKGLKVSGTLDLSYSKIISLPEGLEVGDDLYLHYSKIKSLPQGLKVGRDLYIYGTPLVKYSDDELIEMIQPGFIKGKIYRT